MSLEFSYYHYLLQQSSTRGWTIHAVKVSGLTYKGFLSLFTGMIVGRNANAKRVALCVTAAVILCALCVTVGPFYEYDNADSLVYALVSTQFWTPYYWSQNRSWLGKRNQQLWRDTSGLTIFICA